MLKGFLPSDVYNLDEMGMFYHTELNKTLSMEAI
jgi:hypothetical protein